MRLTIVQSYRMRQLNIRAIASHLPKGTTSSGTNVSRDFFGIFDITSKDIAGAYSSLGQLSGKELETKYEPLLESRTKLENEEKTNKAFYGEVRYDKDNVPQRHGQFDPNNKRQLYDTIKIKQMYVDSNQETVQSSETTAANESPPTIGNPPYKISEVKPVKALSEVLSLFKGKNVVQVTSKYHNKPPLYFEFDNSVEIAANSSAEAPPEPSKELDTLGATETILANDTKMITFDEVEERHKDVGPEAKSTFETIEEFQERIEEAELEVKFNRELDKKYDVPESKGPKKIKAIDYLKKVRSGNVEPSNKSLKNHLEKVKCLDPFKPRVELDSKGFNNYTHQVPDWASIRRVDILDHIKSRIIYHNYDILAINKPYGIASHDEERKRETYDINSLVEEIAKDMGINKVYLAHRLDKTTSGVLIFATSQERARDLNKWFKSDMVKKTYWCITRGIPEPEDGIIDIPIAEHQVAGRVRSCPAPYDIPDEMQASRKFREARRAITEYHTLACTIGAALVEAKPRSGVKHQIRCHLGFGLGTPILGDHKYTSLDTFKPQKLHQRVLKALRLRQEKVRTLPLHLHAKSVVIPYAKANGETLFINAPLPGYFIDNLKSLGLYRSDISGK